MVVIKKITETSDDVGDELVAAAADGDPVLERFRPVDGGQSFEPLEMKLSLDGDLDHMIRGKSGDEDFRPIQSQDLLSIQDQHTVAEAFGLLHEMGCQDDGFPLPVEVLDPLPDHAPALGIKSGGQLIQ